jgi:leader peptidase (prepilin peptidase)/N-methyltransferase
LTELLSSLVWVISWKISGWSLLFVIHILFFSLLIVLFFADLETGLLPDTVTFPGMGAGIVLSFFSLGFGQSMAGFVVGGLTGAVTRQVGTALFKKEAMGLGDVKLIAMLGVFLGWQKVLLAFFIAPFLALPFSLYFHFIRHESTLSYGPFLCLAGAMCYAYGDDLLRYGLG